jgi:hypothetical protein
MCLVSFCLASLFHTTIHSALFHALITRRR